MNSPEDGGVGGGGLGLGIGETNSGGGLSRGGLGLGGGGLGGGRLGGGELGGGGLGGDELGGGGLGGEGGTNSLGQSVTMSSSSACILSLTHMNIESFPFPPSIVSLPPPSDMSSSPGYHFKTAFCVNGDGGQR